MRELFSPHREGRGVSREGYSVCEIYEVAMEMDLPANAATPIPLYAQQKIRLPLLNPNQASLAGRIVRSRVLAPSN